MSTTNKTKHLKLHLKVPDGYYCICCLCCNHVVVEENEITRHFRTDHGHRTDLFPPGRKGLVYNECRLIPEAVAAQLFHVQTIIKLKKKNHDAWNENPKTRKATIQEMQVLYNHRRIEIPWWIILDPTSMPVAREVAAVPSTEPKPRVRRSTDAGLDPATSPDAAAATDADDDEHLWSETTTPHATPGQESYMQPVQQGYGPSVQMPYQVQQSQVTTQPPDDVTDFHRCHFCPQNITPMGDKDYILDHCVRNHHNELKAALNINHAGRYLSLVVEGASSHQSGPDYREMVFGAAILGLQPSSGSVQVLAGRCWVCHAHGFSSYQYDDVDEHVKSMHVGEWLAVVDDVFRMWKLEQTRS